MTAPATLPPPTDEVGDCRATGPGARAEWAVAHTRWEPVPSCHPEPHSSLRRRHVPLWEEKPFDPRSLLPYRVDDVVAVEPRSVGYLMLWAFVVWLASGLGFAETVLDAVGIDPGHPVLWQLTEATLWGSLALAAATVWRRSRPAASVVDRGIIALGVVAGCFHVALFAAAGVMMGFGHSPYSSRPAIVVANVVYFVSVLVAIELCRACVVAALAPRSTTLAVVVGAFGFAVLMIPLARWNGFSGWEPFGAFVGGDALPAVAAGLLASFLALIGGPIPAVAYRGIVEAAEWLSPILPSLTWQMTALIGTLAPLLALRLIQPAEPSASTRPQAVHPRGGLGLVAAVIALWFVAGMAGVQPIAVSGPSMEPTLHVGDLVVVQDTEPDQIEIGDVIRYYDGGMSVIHRVVDIETERGRLYFVTRGDANNIDDDPVPAELLNGKVVLTIPKLGWPSVWVRQALD